MTSDMTCKCCESHNTQDEFQSEIKFSHAMTKMLYEITDMSLCYADYKEQRYWWEPVSSKVRLETQEE